MGEGGGREERKGQGVRFRWGVVREGVWGWGVRPRGGGVWRDGGRGGGDCVVWGLGGEGVEMECGGGVGLFGVGGGCWGGCLGKGLWRGTGGRVRKGGRGRVGGVGEGMCVLGVRRGGELVVYGVLGDIQEGVYLMTDVEVA